MKTRYIGFIAGMMLLSTSVRAQNGDDRDFRDDNPRMEVNNYYYDNDYYFSSRIRRFHRSYSAFNYYSPLFTDLYWYDYTPFTWGINIYGGMGPGFGYSAGMGYNYGNPWYDPYGSNFYNGGFYSGYYGWRSPGLINIWIGSRWGRNYYAWNRPFHSYYNDRFHSGSRYYGNDNTPSRRNADYRTASRREENPGYSSREALPRNSRREVVSDNSYRGVSSDRRGDERPANKATQREPERRIISNDTPSRNIPASREERRVEVNRQPAVSAPRIEQRAERRSEPVRQPQVRAERRSTPEREVRKSESKKASSVSQKGERRR